MFDATRESRWSIVAGQSFDKAFRIDMPGAGFVGARVAGALKRYPVTRASDLVLYGLDLASDRPATPAGSRIWVPEASDDHLVYGVRFAPADTAAWGFDEQYVLTPRITLGSGAGLVAGAVAPLVFTVTVLG